MLLRAMQRPSRLHDDVAIRHTITMITTQLNRSFTGTGVTHLNVCIYFHDYTIYNRGL